MSIQDTCAVSRRSAIGAPAPSPGWNLLAWRPLRALIVWGGFPYVFQGLLLGAFVYLAVLGWGLWPPEGVPGKLYAQSNLVTLLVWGVWWPVMIWVAVLLGRVWCGICPLELVANGAERLGRRVGVRQRRLGRWLRSGLLIAGLYFLVQMFVLGAHMHRVPAYTSMLLGGLLGTALVTGLFYRDRAFCRGFCPVGLLLAIYGRGGMLAIRPVSEDVCGGCASRDCTGSAQRDRLDARSCPSLLNPARLDSSADCLVCGQCVKACGSRENMGLFLRRPFHHADARAAVASGPVTVFVMIVSGFVAIELASEWAAAKSAFLWAPHQAAQWLHAAAYTSWIEAVWTLAVVPLAVWTLLGGLVLLAGGAGSLIEAWRRLALPLAILFAAGHMAKGLAKLVSWIGFLPHALQDPTGMETVHAMAAKTTPTPASLLSMAAVSLVSMALVLATAWFAMRESRLADPSSHRSRRLAIGLVAASTLFVVFGWGFLA